jgi:hypothetical protein
VMSRGWAVMFVTHPRKRVTLNLFSAPLNEARSLNGHGVVVGWHRIAMWV